MFVNKIEISRCIKGDVTLDVVNNPSWDGIEEMLAAMDQGELYELKLMEDSEELVMIISGGKGVYHFCIVENDEICVDYWDGTEPTRERVLLNEACGGDHFERHILCYNIEKVILASKEFFKSGSRSNEVQWINSDDDPV